MSHAIEKDWTTLAGLRAVCLLIEGGPAWRCGYVEVSADHPLFGVHYGEHSKVLCSAWAAAQDGPIGKRGVIPMFCVTHEPTKATPERVFDIHGSITYSASGEGGYPIKSDGWWFGFDCNHAGDEAGRTEAYVVSECEQLAKQIVEAAKENR